MKQINVDKTESVDPEDISVCVHDGKIMLNETNLPDQIFRNVLSEYADEDGYITISEVTIDETIISYYNPEINAIEYPEKYVEKIEIYDSLGRLAINGPKMISLYFDKYDIYYRVHAQSYGWLG